MEAISTKDYYFALSPKLRTEIKSNERHKGSNTKPYRTTTKIDNKKIHHTHSASLPQNSEMRLDQQFANLVSRCTKSKNELEHINKSLFTDRFQTSPKDFGSKDESVHPTSLLGFSAILSPGERFSFKDSAVNKTTSRFEIGQINQK